MAAKPWAREKDSRFERSWRRVVVTLQWTSRIPSTSVIRGQISSGICSSAIRSRERKQVRAVYIIRYNLWTHNRWQILFRIKCCGTNMLEQNINEIQLHPGTCEETKKVLKLTGNQKIWVSNSLGCIELCPIPQTSTSGSEWWSRLLPVSRKVRRDKYQKEKARRRNSKREDKQRTSQIFETSKYIMLSLVSVDNGYEATYIRNTFCSIVTAEGWVDTSRIEGRTGDINARNIALQLTDDTIIWK